MQSWGCWWSKPKRPRCAEPQVRHVGAEMQRMSRKCSTAPAMDSFHQRASICCRHIVFQDPETSGSMATWMGLEKCHETSPKVPWRHGRFCTSFAGLKVIGAAATSREACPKKEPSGDSSKDVGFWSSVLSCRGVL